MERQREMAFKGLLDECECVIVCECVICVSVNVWQSLDRNEK